MAQGGSERTKRLIEEILRLIEHGLDAIDVEHVRLEDVVETAWRETNTREATVETDLLSDSYLQADEEWLIEVFENLFHNAVEHGRSGVTVRVAFYGDRIGVLDDGVGIPEHDRADLFVHSHSTAEGERGIGLVVAREICEAPGWTVAAGESDAGGARFETSL